MSWLVYFVLHSLLASIRIKSYVARHIPSLMPWYRLGFNLFAVLFLVIPLWLTFSEPSTYLWRWQGWLLWVANILALMAIAGFFWSLKFYDGQEFLGFKQLKNNVRSVEDQESFRLSPMHRFVRHPWYFLGLVLIWTRDMNLYMFISAVMMTLYFWVGSRLEERKLLVYYGEHYSRYMARVPGIIPLPWKYLSEDEAGRLTKSLP